MERKIEHVRENTELISFRCGPRYSITRVKGTYRNGTVEVIEYADGPMGANVLTLKEKVISQIYSRIRSTVRRVKVDGWSL
jgi:hypothetical protein